MKNQLKYFQEDVILHITLLMMLIAYVNNHMFIARTILIYAILQFISALKTASESRNKNKTEQ